MMGRLQRVAAAIKSAEIDALFVDDLTDIYYLTGISLSAGQVILGGDESQLFVDSRYFQRCQQHSPIPVSPLSSEEKVAFLNRNDRIKILGFDPASLSYLGYQGLQQLVAKVSHPITLKPVPRLIASKVRSIKDADELALLRQAAALAANGFDFACSRLREGVSEKTLARELEIYWLNQQGDRLSFPPIVAFGEHASNAHFEPGDTPLTSGTAVLLDIGVQWRKYQSDMTRVVFYGKPDQEILDVYQVTYAAFQAAVAFCQPGRSLAEMDSAAREVISQSDFAKGCFAHSLGHGVGLQVHEYPKFPSPTAEAKEAPVILEPGMVITIEPGVYLPGLGGVRLEDTFVVTQKGCESLTNRSMQPLIL